MIPIFGMAAAGDPDRLIMMNEVVDTVERPPQLNGVEGGYALFVHGSSMENRYYPGELLYVHPYKPVVPDSFCVVQFGSDPNNPEGAFVKQFKSRDASRVVLKQFNPEKEITLPAKNVISIHRIVGGGEF